MEVQINGIRNIDVFKQRSKSSDNSVVLVPLVTCVFRNTEVMYRELRNVEEFTSLILFVNIVM